MSNIEIEVGDYVMTPGGDTGTVTLVSPQGPLARVVTEFGMIEWYFLDELGLA